jgi:hypothetical protein
MYTSPFLRCIQTAQHITRALEDQQLVGFQEEVQLREQDWGNFQVCVGVGVIWGGGGLRGCGGGELVGGVQLREQDWANCQVGALLLISWT